MTSWAVAMLGLIGGLWGAGAADEVDGQLTRWTDRRTPLMNGSICTPAHTPSGLCLALSSAFPAPHAPPRDPQPLAVLTGQGAPRDGPSGDFLPGKLGGGVNKASRWLPAAARRPWERPSPRGHGGGESSGEGLRPRQGTFRTPREAPFYTSDRKSVV